MNEGEFSGSLSMHFRNNYGDIRVGHVERWHNLSADVVCLSAAYECNQVLKDQSVASTFELVSPDGELLISATILGPRFWRKEV